MTLLMLLTPLVTSASNVTTFSNNESEVKVILDDSQSFVNLDTGKVTLPSDEAVTSAEFTVSTDMVTHSGELTWHLDNPLVTQLGSGLWDNSVVLDHSNFSHFSVSDNAGIKLGSNGFGTDFELDTAGFQNVNEFGHAYLTDGTVIPENCNSGDWCFGLSPSDLNNNYTDDYPGAATFSMLSPALDVPYTSPAAHFSTWFGMHWSKSKTGGSTWEYNYHDCGYVKVRNSTDGGNSWAGWSVIPFDFDSPLSQATILKNFDPTTGTGGLAPVGTGNGKISLGCNGLNAGDRAVTGESDGWGTLSLDLTKHANRTIQLEFVMEFNDIAEDHANSTMPGWYIDDFRIGDPLPQTAWVKHTSRSAQLVSPDNPDGFGLLSLDLKETPSSSFSVDILSTADSSVVIDKSGNVMSGLTGSIIELWDIDTSVYPYIDLRFNFESGADRMTSPTLYGYSLGTRVGTSFNDVEFGGSWEAEGDIGEAITYPIEFNTVDESFSPPRTLNRFSYPVVSADLLVAADPTCVDDVMIDIFTGENFATKLSGSNGQTINLPASTFSIQAQVSVEGFCVVENAYLDLTFGHTSESVSIDVAADNDLEWAMTEPGFGSFGRQQNFAVITGGENLATTESTIEIDASGEGDGAVFMLPRDAEVYLADFIIDENSVYHNDTGFSLSLQSYSYSESLGDFTNATSFGYGSLGDEIGFKNALNSLLQNPALPYGYPDEYGNEWIYFEFFAENNNASTGSSFIIKNLDIMYNWTVSLGNLEGINRELNQGIALGQSSTSSVEVPIKVQALSGGAISLSGLQIQTQSGYQSTVAITGNPVGLYPSGDVIEISTTHSVDSSTQATFAEARLRMESSKGVVELSYSFQEGFTEAIDELDFVSLSNCDAPTFESSTKEITWRFNLNPTWDDTEILTIYANLIASNGVRGIPGAIVLDPTTGNAVENDIEITDFSLKNTAGEVQDLTSANSSRNITLSGEIRLEDLEVSPDPSAYFLTVERRDVTLVENNPIINWTEIANISGPIGGDFNWNVDLGFDAAGTESYRLNISGYNGGDTLCVNQEWDSDGDCYIDFNISIDNYAPRITDVQVKRGTLWEALNDNTWIPPNSAQRFEFSAQDIPNPPQSLTLHYWVEGADDADGDKKADLDEYRSVEILSDGAYSTANYSGIISDLENSGMDPEGRVSLYISGFDLAGNSIDGGSAGFENDLITYISMSKQSPIINGMSVVNSSGAPLYNPGELEYEGKWNTTMYAGNTYHLQVSARDGNGWSDIEYVSISLGYTEDFIITYWPVNNSAYIPTPYVSVLEADENGTGGPQILDLSGTPVVDPFVSEFTIDIPIQFKWNIPGIGNEIFNPTLRIKDYATAIPSPVVGSSIQSWTYSDSFKLDFRAGVSPQLIDTIEPVATDLANSFVFPGDIILLQGQYVFTDGYSSGVYIQPEDEMTMRITREQAFGDGKNYFDNAAETIDVIIQGGGFAIPIEAPIKPNEYVYRFELVDIPDGAVDLTDVQCAGSDQFGCGMFVIKIDGERPEIVEDSWRARDSNGNTIDTIMPSSTLDCVDVEVEVEENSYIQSGSVFVKWGYFTDPVENEYWSVHNDEFGWEPLSSALSVEIIGGDYVLSGDCVDLWPSDFVLDKTNIGPNVRLYMWVEGSDSAGWSIDGGGITDNGVQALEPSTDGPDTARSSYRLEFDQASFRINSVKMTPERPAVGDTVSLDINLLNAGTRTGNVTLAVFSVIENGFPVNETSITTEDIPSGESITVTVKLEEFVDPTTSMYFFIVDVNNPTVELWNGSSLDKDFTVRVSSQQDTSGLTTLLFSGLAALVLILLIVIVVLVRRSGESEFEYEDEEKDLVDLPEQSAYVAPQQSYGSYDASGGGSSDYTTATDYGTGGYGGVSSEMQRALQLFPQWDQATIQGYFDMGWSIEQLQDWVRDNG